MSPATDRRADPRVEPGDPWPRQPVTHQLAEREIQALVGVARGCSDKDLAHTLGITEGQAAYAVRAAASKLGVITRSHAIVRAIAAGYIEVCPDRGEAFRGDSPKSAEPSVSKRASKPHS